MLIVIAYTNNEGLLDERKYATIGRAKNFAVNSLRTNTPTLVDLAKVQGPSGTVVILGAEVEEIFPKVIVSTTPKSEPVKAHVQGMKSVLRGMDILNAIHRDKEKKSVVAKRMGMSSVRLNYLLLKEERAVALALIKTSGLEQQFKSMLVDFEIDAHDTVDFKEEV